MSELEQALRRAAAMTFEEMAFALPMPEGAAPDGPTRSAEVAFSGPFGGRVVLTVEEAMLPELAANMLGADQPPPPAEQADALGELANVLCGNLLPEIAGRQHVFLLEAPRPAADDGGVAPAAVVPMTFDSGSVLVTLYTSG